MTIDGGADGVGNIFSVGVDGSDYQNLYSFTGGTASGRYPDGSLILARTTLYAMTPDGGADGAGNIFSVGVDGSSYQNLYSFTDGADGAYPLGDLTLSAGTLFGMTYEGGASDDGTVFAFTLPAPTPEPGTLALSGSAAAVLVAYGWRRRRRRRLAGGGRRLVGKKRPLNDVFVSPLRGLTWLLARSRGFHPRLFKLRRSAARRALLDIVACRGAAKRE